MIRWKAFREKGIRTLLMAAALLCLSLPLPVGALPLTSASSLASTTKAEVKVGLDVKNGKIVYRKKNGKLLKNGSKVIDGIKYVFGSDGYLTQKYKYYKPGWILQNGKYYYRQDNGKILQRTGLVTIGKYSYYLDKDYSRRSRWITIDGRLYYFAVKNGRRYEKAGFKDIGKYTYYFYNKAALVGAYTISGKVYYFTTKGRLLKNQQGFVFMGHTYNIDSNGVLTELDGSNPAGTNTGGGGGTGTGTGTDSGSRANSAVAKKAKAAAWTFINAHSSDTDTNLKRYEACFRYLLAFQNFLVRPVAYYDFTNPDWMYKFALDCFEQNLTGDCYAFATCMGIIGKELGFSTKLYVAKEDHCFISVNYNLDGKGVKTYFLDNMGAQFFSTISHAKYTISRTYTY